MKRAHCPHCWAIMEFPETPEEGGFLLDPDNICATCDDCEEVIYWDDAEKFSDGELKELGND